MTDYLSFSFNDSPEFIDYFDELPLWSAVFGLLMLKHVELKPGMTVLDIGSGAGFPMIELAERLGSGSKVYGIDPWVNANTRARKKLKTYGVKNVELIESSAATLPFGDNSVDLIVSNLGINNFEDPPAVFKECYRVLKPDGSLALTTNLNGHWNTFYEVFENTLNETGKSELVADLKAHQDKRGNIESITKLFKDSGLFLSRYYEDAYPMNFTDGSAFLNHHFIKLGWLESWKNLVPPSELQTFFGKLEANLNAYAKKYGGLKLSSPMLYAEGVKPASF